MLAYTTSNIFQVRIPISDLNSSSIHLLVRIKDILDCTTELEFSSIIITPDINNILSLMTKIESAVVNSDYSGVINSYSFIGVLYGGNANDVCQILTSFTQILINLAQQNLQLAVNSMFFSFLIIINNFYLFFKDNIPLVSISVSSLYDQSQISDNNTFNLTEYNNRLNNLAAVQEYLMIFINNLTISQIDSIILQGSTLSQLTAMTNQLTRNALVEYSYFYII